MSLRRFSEFNSCFLQVIEAEMEHVLSLASPPPELKALFLGLAVLGQGTGQTVDCTWEGVQKWVGSFYGPHGLLQWMRRLDKKMVTKVCAADATSCVRNIDVELMVSGPGRKFAPTILKWLREIGSGN